MTKRISLLLITLFLALGLWSQEKMISAGMKITRSIKIKKARYKLNAFVDMARPLIIIEGDNITIDFNNAEIVGSIKAASADQFFGLCILVKGGRNITIRNLRAHQYKVGLMAVNTEGLKLENCNLSNNYRQRLNSTQEKEDMSDWMSFHHNEKDEWLRYGAAIYLRDCNLFTIVNCTVTAGQNALMMTRCTGGRVYNNDFSFNSGIGIGLYRSSGNQFLYNRLNFNVRGYSHGIYNRGQDSAGFLVYEQSSQNLFYKNSATHSGDGFFLWAGQTTMDTGKGGCNDNLIMENDFSYAPTNGVELTFSRNRVSGNRIYECDHGIWGGYSYQTKITDNKFRDNRIAIAIEHGQDNQILYNIFLRDKEAIRLWARKEQPTDPIASEWGYAKYRDTRSKNFLMAMNSFNSNPVVMNLNRTDSIRIFGNTYSDFVEKIKMDSTVTNIDSMQEELTDSVLSIPVIEKPMDPFKGNGRFAGRKNIIMTEWGPYDFKSPLIWLINPTDTGKVMKFALLGPKGNWTIRKAKGVNGFSARKGSFPDTITALRVPGQSTDITIDLEYKGAAITNAFGGQVKAGTAYPFNYRKYFQPMDWEVLFYSLDTTYHNPIRTGMLFSLTEKKAPVKTEKKDRLDYAWWGGLKADQQYKQFITLASTTVEMTPGLYDLSVTWDDAVRVYMDDSLILNEWEPAKYKFDESPNVRIPLNIKGKHNFRVEHVELGGFATLQLRFKPRN